MKHEITTEPRNDARTAITVATVAVVSALVLLVLFGGTTFAHADATTTPIISSITASSTDTHTDVTWTTDIPATSQVMYGTTTSYGASSVFDSGLVTNHFVGLSDLTPDALYHYQIMSNNASGTVATSTDNTFTTASTPATSTATSTAPVISAIHTTTTDTTATVTWTTDTGATSQINYGTSTAYDTLSTLDTTLQTDHTVVLSTLIPDTSYHYQIMATNASGTLATSSDQVFSTKVTATTSTSTPDHTLQDLILQIINEIQRIQVQIAALIAAQHNGGGSNGNGDGGNGTTTPPVIVGPAQIDQNGASVKAGTSIDFGGHNFGIEEHVSVTLNGLVVGSAFTNQGGGFSTGSMSVPSVPGTYTYTFTGQNSGLTATAVVTITP